MKTKKKTGLLVFVLLLAALFIGGNYAFYMYQNVPENNKNSNAKVQISVSKGASTRDIAKILKQNNLILNEDVYKLKSKVLKFDGKYNYGMFELTASMNNEQIMKYLTTEKGVESLGPKFTIPEGYTVKQIADRLEESGVVSSKDFINAVNEYDMSKVEVLKNLPNRKNKLEGYLYPSTYHFDKNSKAEEVVEKMIKMFTNSYKKEYVQRAKELGKSIDEIITIAAIIEREAKRPDERTKIAGVIYNRLKTKMKLEMCSTIQYAQGKVKEKLYQKDLIIDSPYNTYKNTGLPVGPICSPGLESIKAALYPEKHDYLYFVLKDEATGKHIFSKTYAEHIKAKNEYEK